MGLRERMKEAARPEDGSEAVNPPASTDTDEDIVEDTEADVEVETPEGAETSTDIEEDIEADTDEPDVAESVSDLVEDMSPEQIAEALAAIAAAEPEAFVAPVKASRVTKKDQVQYDGETPEGYVVRIWAPAGTPMVTSVTVNPVE